QEYMADPELWTRRLHPDDRDVALATYHAGRACGGPFPFECRLIGREGREVWFRDSAVVVLDQTGAPAFVQGVMLDITDSKHAEEQATYLAYHDKLTGLPNKAMFEELLGLAIARARRYDLAVAVITTDVDDFKLVNDILGHERGDELLGLLAERLREATRETDLVARQGGDEFLFLLSDLERGPTGRGQAGDPAVLIAETVAARIQEALAAPFELEGTEVYVSASVGVAVFPNHANGSVELIKNADVAMYQSKRVAPGGYAVYADEAEDALGRLSMSTRLR